MESGWQTRVVPRKGAVSGTLVLACRQNRGPSTYWFCEMALVAKSLRKCLEQLQPGSAGGRWGKPAGKPRTESTRTLWHGRREGRECTKTLKHGVSIRRVAQAAPMASTGLTRTHGPFRMRNLLSHKDEWHSWVITHTKNLLLPPA